MAESNAANIWADLSFAEIFFNDATREYTIRSQYGGAAPVAPWRGV